jgi:protein-disulfide isomerase
VTSQTRHSMFGARPWSASCFFYRMRAMKKAFLFVFIVGLIFSFAAVSCAEKPKPISNNAGFTTKGSPDAPITMIVFSDFECPACRDAAKTVDLILHRYGDQVYFIYRYYPLGMHKNSFQAAVAAECAREQGKFWEFHDYLYGNQFDWNGPMPVNLTDPGNKFISYASKFGMSIPAFRSCLTSDRAPSAVKASRAEGDELRVASTPTFFINGKRVVGRMSLEAEYEKLFQAALKKKK